jgi:3,4-dihydroxy 2-butanone 4-phosphate synthase/GTP cyclohydrolase II
MVDIANHRPVAVFDAARLEFIAVIGFAAESATAADLEFLRRVGRGPVSLMMSKRRLEELGLAASEGQSDDDPIAWTTSVNLRGRSGITLGDQIDTIRALCDPKSRRSDFICPGTVVPFACDDIGVLRRRRASIAVRDLVDAAGLYPAALTSAILDDSGGLAGAEFVSRTLRRHSIRAVAIEDVIALQWQRTPVLSPPFSANMPTVEAMFRVFASRSLLDGSVVAAVVHGTPTRRNETVVHVHRGEILSDVFRDAGSNCARRLSDAINAIAHSRAGVLIYLRAESARPSGDGEDDCRSPLSAHELGLAAQMIHFLSPHGRLRFHDLSQAETETLQGILAGIQFEWATRA